MFVVTKKNEKMRFFIIDKSFIGIRFNGFTVKFDELMGNVTSQDSRIETLFVRSKSINQH